MNVECPSCHLTGTVNELELPPEGRFMNCPRCNTGFQIAKPLGAAGNAYLMSSCPACQYSTFSDETFAVCPKCGLSGKEYQDKRRRQDEIERQQRDQEVLHRSHRNPELILPQVTTAAVEQVAIPNMVRSTGWLCSAAGAAFLCYGLISLVSYYSNDWQAILSEPLLEPLSKTRVFFRLAFIPWLTTLVSAYFLAMANELLRLKAYARKGLVLGAWGGLAITIIHETAGFINWVGNSSSSPSFSYYAIGVVSSLLMAALWGAPCLALVWFLSSDLFLREFPEE